MAKVIVRKKEGSLGNSVNHDYEYLFDGKPLNDVLSKVTSVNINMKAGGFPELTITAIVDDLEVDGEFILAVEPEAGEEK
jgi:hypothetical protein